MKLAKKIQYGTKRNDGFCTGNYIKGQRIQCLGYILRRKEIDPSLKVAFEWKSQVNQPKDAIERDGLKEWQKI